MSAARLTARQVRFTNKSFWRNPASAFFTFAFPLMFLVIFTALLGGGDVRIKGTDLRQTTYYVVAMATFGVISACFTNIAISVCFNRDQGILKRTRGTPLPGWSYLSGRVIHSMIVGAILVVITLVFGWALYDGTFPMGTALAEFVITFAVGRAFVRRIGAGADRRDPERGRGPADRERRDPAAPVPLRDLLPAR